MSRLSPEEEDSLLLHLTRDARRECRNEEKHSAAKRAARRRKRDKEHEECPPARSLESSSPSASEKRKEGKSRRISSFSTGAEFLLTQRKNNFLSLCFHWKSLSRKHIMSGRSCVWARGRRLCKTTTRFSSRKASQFFLWPRRKSRCTKSVGRKNELALCPSIPSRLPLNDSLKAACLEDELQQHSLLPAQ